ncbi:uncharacterized protein LOC129314101 [Prosopis cineraria]|uniref:uncharacterized protein LOC129314101 n=1 Tax=Prosopis cineraria TaxID=364024 RepID=UPI0024101424|nr:uncharacterized protein LOC129314101 [Prosopis cineraria]
MNLDSEELIAVKQAMEFLINDLKTVSLRMFFFIPDFKVIDLINLKSKRPSCRCFGLPPMKICRRSSVRKLQVVPFVPSTILRDAEGVTGRQSKSFKPSVLQSLSLPSSSVLSVAGVGSKDTLVEDLLLLCSSASSICWCEAQLSSLLPALSLVFCSVSRWCVMVHLASRIFIGDASPVCRPTHMEWRDRYLLWWLWCEREGTGPRIEISR